jgi:hypothetical protein
MAKRDIEEAEHRAFERADRSDAARVQVFSLRERGDSRDDFFAALKDERPSFFFGVAE